ncbi:response regulator transcription factor [Lactococcus petauri]|uniref:response regulator transcription factor n=1 Tax=Lactococcus petauri TaxID=1940789 RepID=UPI003851D972
MKKILLVEDDKQIMTVATSFLKDAGYIVIGASDGVAAYEQWKKGAVDLIVTDIMMPRMDGYALTELIRMDNENVPIFMITALSGEADELKGLELGVNDYIQKPFSYKIFLKRIENIFRRHKVSPKDEFLTCGSIQIFPKRHLVMAQNKEVQLTKKEFDILYVLMKKKNFPVSREAIIDQVWDYGEIVDTTMLNSHVKNLRKKLYTEQIETIRGVGYKISESI